MRGHFLRETRPCSTAFPSIFPVGVHLCYGDPGHKHIIEPDSLALSVDLAQTLTAAGRKRRIDWFHCVPRDRDDDAYVAPLPISHCWKHGTLSWARAHNDGVEGARRRIAPPSAIARFRIATECRLRPA